MVKNKTKKALTLIIAIIILATATQAIDTTDNLLWWTFDDADIVGSNNPGDVSAHYKYNGTTIDATTGVAGLVLGESFDFDASNDYIDANIEPDNEDIGMSFTFWIKSDTITVNPYEAIIGKTGTNSDDIAIRLQTDEKLDFYVRDDGGAGTATAEGSSIIAGNGTQFVACVYNTTHLIIYVNAIQEGTASIDIASDWNPNADVFVAARNDNSNPANRFNGTLDELSYWNRTLTLTEIQELYNSGAGYNPYSGAGTLTIGAKDFFNNTYIADFNVTTEDNITWTPTAGVATINYTSGTTRNLTIQATNYNTVYYYEYNGTLSGNLNASMYHESDETKLLDIRAKEPDGTLLETSRLSINGTVKGTSNPYTELLTNYINVSKPTGISISISIEDLAGYYATTSSTQTINGTNHQINITMTPYQAIFYFQQDQGANNYTITEYRITDTEAKTLAGNATNVTINLTTFQEGKVKMKFNDLDNWSQYYEFIYSEESEPINETFELLESADYTIYFLVKDYGNTELEDVTIRIDYIEDFVFGVWGYDKLLGQRMTNADGTTYFLGDAGTELKIQISKEGYESVTLIHTLSDEDYGRSTQYNIYLKAEGTDYGQVATAFLPTKVYNKTSDIKGLIVAKNATSVKINTIYRTALGMGNLSLQADSLGRYDITLEDGTHFTSATDDNISIDIYIDNRLWRTINITYDDGNKTTILIPTETLNEIYLNPIILIALILLSGGLGVVFRQEKVGMHTYLIGGIIIGLIANAYIWLAGVNFAYYMMKIAKKIISE